MDETKEILPGDVVEHIGNPSRPPMTVSDVVSVGGEDAYQCAWLDDEKIMRTWHRRTELKLINR